MTKTIHDDSSFGFLNFGHCDLFGIWNFQLQIPNHQSSITDVSLCGQLHDEGAAVSSSTGYFYSAGVLFHDGIGDGKPQSYAFSYGSGRKKRVEYFIDVFSRYAASRIRYPKQNVPDPAFCGEGQDTSVRHGCNGVQEKVEEQLLEKSVNPLYSDGFPGEMRYYFDFLNSGLIGDQRYCFLQKRDEFNSLNPVL
jgi:hypothetical protein